MPEATGKNVNSKVFSTITIDFLNKIYYIHIRGIMNIVRNSKLYGIFTDFLSEKLEKERMPTCVINDSGMILYANKIFNREFNYKYDASLHFIVDIMRNPKDITKFKTNGKFISRLSNRTYRSYYYDVEVKICDRNIGIRDYIIKMKRIKKKNE